MNTNTDLQTENKNKQKIDTERCSTGIFKCRGKNAQVSPTEVAYVGPFYVEKSRAFTTQYNSNDGDV